VDTALVVIDVVVTVGAVGWPRAFSSPENANATVTPYLRARAVAHPRGFSLMDHTCFAFGALGAREKLRAHAILSGGMMRQNTASLSNAASLATVLTLFAASVVACGSDASAPDDRQSEPPASGAVGASGSSRDHSNTPAGATSDGAITWCSTALIRSGDVAGTSLDYPSTPDTTWFNTSVEEMVLDAADELMMREAGPKSDFPNQLPSDGALRVSLSKTSSSAATRIDRELAQRRRPHDLDALGGSVSRLRRARTLAYGDRPWEDILV
jgi:hypothetical protein